MRVLVYASTPVAGRVKQAFSGLNLEVLSVSSEMINLQTAEWLYGLTDPATVIIDTREPGAEQLCHHFELFARIPVVLLVDPTSDWNRLASCHAVGFVSHSAGQAEFACRLKKCLPVEPAETC